MHRRLWSLFTHRIFLKMKSYDDKRYSGMLDTSYGAPQSPIGVFGDDHRPDGHPKMTYRGVASGEIQSSSNTRNPWKIQYVPRRRVFKLRYLCDYWELEAEIKTGERFRFVFCISKTGFTIPDSQPDWIESRLATTIQY